MSKRRGRKNPFHDVVSISDMQHLLRASEESIATGKPLEAIEKAHSREQGTEELYKPADIITSQKYLDAQSRACVHREKWIASWLPKVHLAPDAGAYVFSVTQLRNEEGLRLKIKSKHDKNDYFVIRVQKSGEVSITQRPLEGHLEKVLNHIVPPESPIRQAVPGQKGAGPDKPPGPK